MKRLLTLVLVAVMLCGVVPFASAVTLTPISIPGWEDWKTEVYQFYEGTDPKMYFTCPKTDVTDEEMFYYAGKLMSEVYASGIEYIMFFPQPSWNVTDFQDWFLRTGGANSRRWLIDDSYTEINRYYEDGVAWIAIQPASVSIPLTSEVADKVKEIGDAAKATSNTVRGQLDFINNWLCDNVKYDYDGSVVERYSAVGALAKNAAVCGGYAGATALLCDFLGIPNLVLTAKGTDGVDHVWNSVYVDDSWKQLDTTWNATNSNHKKYFLVDSITDNKGYHNNNIANTEKKQVALLEAWECTQIPMRRVSEVEHLVESGVLRGDQNGNLNLNAGLTRAELAAILTRINSAEDTVMADKTLYTALCTFADVPDWAKPYVGYCVEQGLVQGYNATTYGAADPVTPAAACTVILRHMGYAETDWNYNTAVSKAASVGLVSQYWPTGTVALRNDIAALAYATLTTAK